MFKLPHKLLLFTVTTVLACCTAWAQDTPSIAAADAAPDTVVITLENALLHGMRTPFGHTARVDYLRPIVTRSFDTARMARFLFGSSWRQQPETIQTDFITAFTELSAASYADRFKRYNQEVFGSAGEPLISDRKAQVRRTLATDNGTIVPFDYALLQNASNEWRIVNVIARGVSDLALKRTQYRQLLDQGGMQAVIDYIRSEINRLARQNENR